MSIQLLITDAFHGDSLAYLKGHLDSIILRSADTKPTAEELKDCEGLLIRSRTRIEESLLRLAPKLRFIVTATSGFDHIDLDACEKRKIVVAFTPDANASSAAELTLGLMLSLLRKLPKALKQIDKNHWRKDELRAEVAEGKTLGLIGLGRIGQRVAKFGQALNMKVLAYDPYIEDSIFQKTEVERLGLSEVLVSSDVVSFHVPLTSETFHIVNHQTLQVINPEALLINTSRGGVVDENELIVALESGRLRGAALDVFEREPLIKESRLRQLRNVILTPHIGAFTREAIARASQQAAQKTVDFFAKGECSDMLPLETPWFAKIKRKA